MDDSGAGKCREVMVGMGKMGFGKGAVFGGKVEGFLHCLIPATCLAGGKVLYTGWRKYKKWV